MSDYVFSIKMAFISFSILSFFITAFIIIYEYRKNGYFNLLESLMLYVFIFYLQVIYLLVILPLPDSTALAQASYTWVDKLQLIPFRFIFNVVNQSRKIDFSFLALIKIPSFYQAIFNLILLLPLGIFLKNLFQFSFKKVLLTSFLVSLSFELLQLTGLLFIYPRPYRLFDVDDLILNTSGALIGYFMAPLLMIFFPRAKELAIKKKYAKTHITLFPQFVAYLLDLILFDMLIFILVFIYSVFNFNEQTMQHLIIAHAILCFFILPLRSNKYETLGLKILNYAYREAKQPSYSRRLLRSLLVYGPYLLSRIFNLNIFYWLFICYFVVAIMRRKKRLIFDRQLNFKVIRTA